MEGNVLRSMRSTPTSLIYCPRFSFYVPHWMLASTSAAAASAAAASAAAASAAAFFLSNRTRLSSIAIFRSSSGSPAQSPTPICDCLRQYLFCCSSALLRGRTTPGDRGRIEW